MHFGMYNRSEEARARTGTIFGAYCCFTVGKALKSWAKADESGSNGQLAIYGQSLLSRSWTFSAYIIEDPQVQEEEGTNAKDRMRTKRV